jgi:hypothetical protein
MNHLWNPPDSLEPPQSACNSDDVLSVVSRYSSGGKLKRKDGTCTQHSPSSIESECCEEIVDRVNFYVRCISYVPLFACRPIVSR